MSEWSPQDWAAFFVSASAFLAGAYVAVVRPLLIQLRELITSLKENTTATDTSATALTVLAPAVAANTVVTRAVADAPAPSSPVTVNVSSPPDAPTPIR